MCTSIYLGALCAGAAMARELGHADDAASYEKLAAKGAKFMDESLFNGEYFFQRVQWKDLKDQSFAKQIAADDNGDEVLRLLKAEGPKYQYGTGCLSDGVIGAWMEGIRKSNSSRRCGQFRRTASLTERSSPRSASL